MAKGEFIVIRGVLNYPKIVGPARPHTGLPEYDKGPYWSVDVSPDAKSMELLKKYGIEGKLKDPSPKDKNRAGNDKFLSLRVLENRTDGTKNSAPKVQDITGVDWNNGNIGNGSVGDVKVKVVDYGRGSQKGVYLQAVRVLSHVPYEVEDFAPLSEDDEFFAEQEGLTPEVEEASFDNDLNDDVPF